MSKRVLIVEDDPDIRMSMIELLEDAGYGVSGAVNGAAALGILKLDSGFDLIILDLMMPVMDGFEFRSRQKADVQISGIPVIVMSADGHVSEKMKRASVEDYVKKPVDISSFLETIARKLAGGGHAPLA
jgi:CheY-like chemotaxis protein